MIKTIAELADLRWLTRRVADLHTRFKGGGRLDGNGGETDPLMVGPTSPALERYREKQCELKDMDIADRKRELVSATGMQEVFIQCGERLKKANDELERIYGRSARDPLDNAMGDMSRLTEAFLADEE